MERNSFEDEHYLPVEDDGDEDRIGVGSPKSADNLDANAASYDGEDDDDEEEND